MNYTTGDFLIRLKNAYMAHRTEAIVPFAKTTMALGAVLKEEGYIKDINEEVIEGKKMIKVKLSYTNRAPSMLDVIIISKPSFRVYVTKNEAKGLLRDMGTHIVSTNGGVLSAQNAVKKGLGGELICRVI